MNSKKINKKVIILIILFLALLLVGVIIYFFNKPNYIKNDIPYVDDNIDKKVELNSKEELLPKEIIASVPIFMYHFILSDYGNYPDTENFLKPETLEEQLKYISENGYQTIFMNEIESLYKYDKPVALTFDDCFVYFYNNAFPLLKKYNQKATICLIYNYINGENYLTDEQIKEMIDSGLVSVESHTLSHRELTTLSDEEERKEILESKEKLENDFNISLSTICYPVGDYNKDTINVAKEQYKYGLAMTGGMYHSNIHDLYSIPRIYANRTMPLSTYINYLKQSKVELVW